MAKFTTGTLRFVATQSNSGGEPGHEGQATKPFLHVKGQQDIEFVKHNITTLWKSVKEKFGPSWQIPEVIYFIMSSEDKVKSPSLMRTFLQKVVEGALQTGALIVTNGIYHGVTRMLYEVLEQEKNKQKGFCLRKDVYLVAIVPETQISNWSPQYKLKGTALYVDYQLICAVGRNANTGTAHLDSMHDFYILVENGKCCSRDENIRKTYQIAVELINHLQITYSNKFSKYVPKSGNQEREFNWFCDGCRQAIVGPGAHCSLCGDYDLCSACDKDSKWKEGHDEVHASSIMKFDTWNTGYFTPIEQRKGSWRCTVCSKHIWDTIYTCTDDMCKGDILCGDCYKWKKFQRGHKRKKECFEDLCHGKRAIALTWFLMQGGKAELQATCDALEKDIRILATYMERGAVADMVAFVYIQRCEGRITENQIKGIVQSTLGENCKEEDFVVYEKCLQQIANVKKAPVDSELVPIIICGTHVSEDALQIIRNAIYKAVYESPNARLQLITGDRNLFESAESLYRAQKMLNLHINRQNISYEGVMMSALVLGKTNFVKLFIEYGMPLGHFCDRKTLGKLYHSVLFYEDLLPTRGRCRCADLIKSTLSNSVEDKIKSDETELFKVIGKFITRLTEGIVVPDYASLDNGQFSEKDLFIWALLFGRIDLAKVILRTTENHIALALVGCKILRSMSDMASVYEESHLSETLFKSRSDLAKLASDCIHACYKEDKKMSHKLLEVPLRLSSTNQLYGDLNCLNVAWFYHNENFLSQPCCQTQLTMMWHGQDGKKAETRKGTGFLQKANRFLFAPRTQFCFNVLSMIILLVLFTTFVLTDLHPYGVNGAPSVLEWIVVVWMFLFTIEEIRLVPYIYHFGTLRSMFKNWFLRQWNMIKIIMLGLFWISFIARILVKPYYFVWVRILYSLSLLMCYLSLLPFAFAFDQLGPKLIMIKKMVKELLIFLAILVVFYFAFGTAYMALQKPNHPMSVTVFASILYQSYFRMHGDLLTDDIEVEGENITCNVPSDPGCAVHVWFPVLIAIYVLIANVLLLNLLIAVFSMYIEDMQLRSDKIWAFYRYGLIKEYTYKAPFFPFGCFFYWIYQLVLQIQCFRGTKYACVPDSSNVKDDDIFEVEDFEHNVIEKNWKAMQSEKDSDSSNEEQN
ncbi:transient receptor potential cation channel subfamily M member 3-like [Ptychodera flava]|uniref:transient receptor potential cation channel subfamily M member 3-like n=1 Tax=Ptychodera flava TaxID=63121 RepID=UPI00396A5E44